MKAGSNPYKEASFIEKLWNHHFFANEDGVAYPNKRAVPVVDTEEDEDGIVVDEIREETIHVKHWGRWQTCTKCNESELVGNMSNHLSFRGVLVLLGTLAVLGVAIAKGWPLIFSIIVWP